MSLPAPRPRFPLETPRLLLRPFEPSDARQIIEACRQRRVSRGIPTMPYPYRANDARLYVRRALRDVRSHQGYPLGAVERSSDTLIGAIEIGQVNWTHRHAELGYWITPSRWGRGYATEAARRMCDFGFGVLRLHRLHAGVLSFNPASARVLRRVGFHPEGTQAEFFRVGGRWHDVARFALLSDEFRRGTRPPTRTR